MSGLQSGIVKPTVGVRGTVVSDTLGDARLEHGPNGFVARRQMKVEATGSGPAVLYNALITRGVPYYGQSHPVIVGLPCANRVATLEPNSTNLVNIDITYAFPSGSGNLFINDPDDMTPGAASIEISTTVQSSTTQLDYEDNWLTVPEYTYEVDDGSGTGTMKEVTLPARTVKVEYQLPMLIVRYRRRERAVVDGLSLFAKSRLYTGKINAATSAHPLTFWDPKHYWMINSITGQSDDGGLTANVTYEFQRNPDTWRTLIVPTDANGNVPSDLPEEQKVYKQLYDEIDFWPLNLTTA